MVGGDKQRASFLVARPSRYDETRLLGSTPMIDEFLGSTVRPDEKLPSISRRVTANLCGIFHRHSPRRTLPQWQFLHTQVFYIGAGVPVSMEGEQKPIVIVVETRIDFIFHGVGLAAELGAHIGNLDGLGLPNPRAGEIHSRELCIPRVADRINLPERIETIRFGDLF